MCPWQTCLSKVEIQSSSTQQALVELEHGASPNLHFHALPVTQIYTSPNLPETQIYTTPNLTETQIYTKPNLPATQIYT